jgi:hypothetical protein
MLKLQLYLPLLVSLAITQVRASYSDALQACISLYRSLPEQVFFPQSQEYEASLSSYAYIGTRLRPTCLTTPKSTQDVVNTIRTLSHFESVPVAVRSGGHNTNIGFYSHITMHFYSLMLCRFRERPKRNHN